MKRKKLDAGSTGATRTDKSGDLPSKVEPLRPSPTAAEPMPESRPTAARAADADRRTGDGPVIRLPVLPPAGEIVGYLPEHIETRLSPGQGLQCRRLFEGLQRKAARLASGKFVQTPVDAVRWLFEEIGE